VVAALAVFAFGAWQLRDGPVNWYQAEFGRRPLLAAKTWHYQLDRIDVDEIAKSKADLIVMDHAKLGGKVALSSSDVERIKVRPDGSRRLVVAYLSVGEAEDFRYYWRPEWSNAADKSKVPPWLKAPNCAWPGAHAVRFWHSDWKQLIYGGAESYLSRIVKAGFDGVYLDRVDIYDQFKTELTDPEGDMVTFVTELAAAARRLKPGFLIIPQNGEDLLQYRGYRRVIDGLGKEDLLHGQGGTGVRNTAEDISGSVENLKMLLADRKPIFSVEYLVSRERIAETGAELKSLGLVPTNAHRSLNGTDPTMPSFDSKPAEGTPEYTRAMCDKTNSW
jgi:cysteinyl-tRNA synthetase, unknown class